MLQGLDALPDGPLGGGLVRWVALECAVEPTSAGGRPSERRMDAPCPDEVARFGRRGAGVPSGCAQRVRPPAREGSVLARLRRAVPASPARGRSTLLRRAGRRVGGTVRGLGVRPGCAARGRRLARDASAVGARADVVASILPPNQGEWTDARPDAHDARWAFGVPPRNKANLAWLQHAHAHRAPGGYAVLAAADALLHEKRGCEPTVRAALIASGCVP
ncbi:MAG: N-6 DNA methylase [Eggerthellaceae bacterium]